MATYNWFEANKKLSSESIFKYKMCKYVYEEPNWCPKKGTIENMTKKTLQDVRKLKSLADLAQTFYYPKPWKVKNTQQELQKLYRKFDCLGFLAPEEEPKCECGAEKTGSNMHYNWCPKKGA